MANEREGQVLTDTRAEAAALARAADAILSLRARFDALGGTTGFQGTGKLFAADGSGQVLPYTDFLGVFNALGALEADTEWPAFLSALARARS